MLSSALTTISVFLPLIFMSGIAGAIFFDQAFSVTVGLLVSYITGIILLPVLYKLIYMAKAPRFISKRIQRKGKAAAKAHKISIPERIYHKGADWIFTHKTLTVIVMILVFPFCIWLFSFIRKEKMPDISQNELMVNIEWNENIHLQENNRRTASLLQHIEKEIIENSALIGRQQYLLNREREKTVTESEIYLKLPTTEDIPRIKETISKYMTERYPLAIVSYSPVGTIFE